MHEEEIVFGEKLTKEVVNPGGNTSNQVVTSILKLKTKSLDIFVGCPYYREASFAQFVHKQEKSFIFNRIEVSFSG